MEVKLDDVLKPLIRVGVLRLGAVRIPEDHGDALWRRLDAVCEALHERWRGVSVSEIPGVQEARALYRSVRLDPTKTRPSSEALLRRAVKGKGLFRVHPLVDLFNLVSLTELLPVGLYDESKIAGTAACVRLGADGWGFDGIRKDRVNVSGRLCLADDLGPFGSPTSDSLRTSIEGSVQDALAVFFQPASGALDRMERALDSAAALGAEHLDAVIVSKNILGH